MTGPETSMDLRTLFESTGVAMLLMDPELNILMVNSEFTALMGYDVERIVGNQNWKKLIHPDDLPKIEDTARRRNAGEGVGNIYDFRLFDAAGSIHDIRMKVNMLPDGNRLVSLLDVTNILEEKRSRHEVEQIFENLFNDSRDGVFISDLEGKIIRMNPAGLRMFGYGQDEIRGINARQLYRDPRDRDRLVEMITTNGYVKDFEVKLIDRHGKTMDCLITSSARRDNAGKVVGMSGMMKDVTSRIRYVERINELNDILRQITGILRHDMMNNLMIIENAVQMTMADKKLDRLDMMLSSVRRSVSLINRMKEFEASISTAEGANRYSFGYLVEDSARDSGIRYDVADDSGSLLDPGFFTVVQNLIVNAILHGGADHMTFLARREDGHDVIEISDNGKGIPVEIRDRIFEQGFSFGENKGSGTGLYLVKTMVERMGGKVTVHDNDPSGTIFRITLPASLDRGMV